MTTDALLDELIRANQTQIELLRQIAGRVGGGGNTGGGNEDPDKPGMFKRGLMALGSASVDTAKSVVTLGQAAFDGVLSMSSVAGALTGLPGPLGMIASVAQIAATHIEKMSASYSILTSSGVNFGGSLTTMKLAAAGTYMSLEQFSSMLKQNSATLAMMGGSVDAGAQSFAKISNTLNKSPAGEALRGLGYTSEQVNQGLLSYISITGGRNKEELKTVEGQRQLAASAAAYMTQLDGLAQITGQSREEQEKALKAEMEEASFQAFMATKSKAEQEAIAASMASAGALYGKAGQDIVRSTAMGIAVQGEAGQKLTALSGGTAEAIQRDLEIRKKGGNNLAELNANEARGRAETAKNLMPLAGAVGTAGGALKGMDVAVKNMAAAQQAGIKGEQGFLEQRKEIAAKQETQAKSQAAAVAKTQMSMNELGQQIMAKLMPAFMFMMNITLKLANGLAAAVGPVIAFGTKVIGEMIQPFLKFWDTLSGAVMSMDWAGIGSAAKKTFDILWSSIKEVFQPVFDKGAVLFKTIGDDLGPVFRDFSDIFKLVFARIQDVIGLLKTYVWPIMKPIAEGIVDSMIPLWNIFKFIIKSIKALLSGDFAKIGENFKSIFEELTNVFIKIKEGISGAVGKFLSFFGGNKTDEAAKSKPKPPEQVPAPEPKKPIEPVVVAAPAKPIEKKVVASPAAPKPTETIAAAKPPENPKLKSESEPLKVATAPVTVTTSTTALSESTLTDLQTLNKQTADMLRVMREVAEYSKRNVDATRSLNKNLFA